MGGGRNRCIMLIMTLLKLWGGGVNREIRERARERDEMFTQQKSPDGTDTSSVIRAGGQISPTPPNPPQPVQISITIQHDSMGPTQQYGPWIHLIDLYKKLLIDL